MENILEFLYNLPHSQRHGQDSTFARTVRIRNEYKEMLSETMTDEQKEMLEAYLDADAEVEGIMHFDRFCYAFHFGAELMKELTEGKEGVL